MNREKYWEEGGWYFAGWGGNSQSFASSSDCCSSLGWVGSVYLNVIIPIIIFIIINIIIILFPLIFRPLVFAFHMTEEERPVFERFIHSQDNSRLCAKRVTLLAYISQPDSFFSHNFPINILRNIAIRNTVTSHFLLLDMDILISANAYYNLLDLPRNILRNSRSAVILPIFFSSTPLPESMRNDPLETQFQSILLDVPRTLTELRECRIRRRCSERKGKLWTHVGWMWNYINWKIIHSNIFDESGLTI